jgi:MFS transporter, FHS family, Na+ dependent glucose transporter 1
MVLLSQEKVVENMLNFTGLPSNDKIERLLDGSFGVIMEKRETTGKVIKKREILTFVTYSVCFISLGLAMAALGPMLPSLADLTGVSIAKISFVFTANSLGYMIGSAGGGRLYDRFKGHWLMVLALVLMAIGGTLIPLLSQYVLLLFVLFLLGLGMGLVDVGANVNLLWIFQSRVGPYMNALHFFFGVGSFLSPIILTIVMTWSGGSITWPFWVLSLLFLPGLMGLILLPSPINPEAHDETKTSNKPDVRLIVLMMALFFLYVAVEAGYGGWIFTYATGVNIANDTTASYMNSLYWGMLTLGRLIAVPLARKIKPATMLIGNFVFSVLFLAVILVWPVSPIMIWVGSAGLGFALSSVFPTLLALGETRLKITGAVTGLFFLGSSLGGTVVPMLLGQIYEYIGSYQLMLTLFALTCVGLIVLVSMILASNRVGEKTRV